MSGTSCQLRSVPLQLGQIMKRIGIGELPGVNQTHEQITDLGPVLTFIKEPVLAMQNDFLERSFAYIVVEGGSRLA
jgi:hypothetical protein